MAAILVGLDGDLVGTGLIPVSGAIVTASTVKTLMETKKPIRIGDSIAAHAPGGIHNSATMAAGSLTVLIEGIGVCRHGDAATCGHTLIASAIKTLTG